LEVIPSCWKHEAHCGSDSDIGTCSDRMNTQLNDEELVIEMNLLLDDNATDNDDADKAQYHVVTYNDKTRLRESGRISQHYDFKDLKFEKIGGSDTNDDDDNDNMILDNSDVTFYMHTWYSYTHLRWYE
jgi:hypothetical protein